jgi:hypothetical protein
VLRALLDHIAVEAVPSQHLANVRQVTTVEAAVLMCHKDLSVLLVTTVLVVWRTRCLVQHFLASIARGKHKTDAFISSIQYM